MNRILFLMLLFPTCCFAGAWGVGSFENDSALDWVYELETSSSAKFLISTMSQVPDAGYIDVDSCSAAMAAIEIVASLNQNSTEHLPEEVQSWLTVNSIESSNELKVAATQTLDFCSSSENSELAQLWEESLPEEWAAYISELKSRL